MAENREADQVLVRELLARELETVNTYWNLMQRAQDESVRQFIRHVLDEEKEHIAEAFAVLRQLDPAQAAVLDSGGHAPSMQAAATPQPPAEVAREEFFARQQFTVGSLRGVPQDRR